MKKLILCCAGVLLLTACATGQKDPGRVGQMYFTTIAFDVNGDEIATASYKQIDEAVKVYMRNPTVPVEVRGYTDSSGNAQSNLRLSQKRADRVAKALQIPGRWGRNAAQYRQKPLRAPRRQGRQSRAFPSRFPSPLKASLP